MKTRKTIPSFDLYNQFREKLEGNNILFINAYTGAGKTSFVLDFLDREKTPYIYISCAGKTEAELTEKAAACKNKVLVLDDIDRQPEKAAAKKILEPRTAPSFAISRGRKFFGSAALELNNRLFAFNEEDLTFTPSDIQKYCAAEKIEISKAEIVRILRSAAGWPIAVSIFLRAAAEGIPPNESIREAGRKKLYEFFDVHLLANMDRELQDFCLKLSLFTSFSEGLATAVAGSRAAEIMDKIETISSFLSRDTLGEYHMIPFFRTYLRLRFKTHCSPDDEQQIYEAAGEYYEDKDLVKAAVYYNTAKNQTALIRCLKKNAMLNPGVGAYYDLEKYYLALPESVVASDPELMSALSMLHALYMRDKESNYWYERLEAFSKSIPKGSPQYLKCQESLFYLKIALPQNGVAKMKDVLMCAAKLVTENKMDFRSFSLTGNMPSIMNGGKDFCEWSKNDKLLYRLMKMPAQLVLGKRIEGFADLSLGESLYEKSTTEEFSEPMMWLNTGLSSIQSRGDLQASFAGFGTIARLFAARGNMDVAKRMINNLREDAAARGSSLILTNIDAYMINQKMMCGQTADLEQWIECRTPDEHKPFRITDRYVLFIKAKAYITLNRCDEAIMLLNILKNYAVKYERHYGNALMSIYLYIAQQKSGYEKDHRLLEEALSFCYQYSFLRPLADEGAPVLSVLQDDHGKTVSAAFKKKLMIELRKQAALYPNFLKSETGIPEDLTETEKKVLLFVTNGLSNAEIAGMMFISVNTVKYHLSNIFSKLNVKNRMAAGEWAKKNLI